MADFPICGMRILLSVLLLTFMIFEVQAFPMESQASLLDLPSTVPLRILPLGNSITFGYLSSDGNGYRKTLLDKLTANGTTVKYIGSVQSGNMTDNHNEGHPGAIITQIGDFANASLPQRPNVILLMAGTNDMAQSLNVSDAPRRLGVLIDKCHAACPDAVILVAQLTPSSYNSTQANVAVFNPTIPRLVETRVMNGTKALVVDMSAFVMTADLIDGLHPNDAGYQKMAQGWLEGLKEAQAKGWITPPVNSTMAILAPTPAPKSNTSNFTSGASQPRIPWSFMAGLLIIGSFLVMGRHCRM